MQTDTQYKIKLKNSY